MNRMSGTKRVLRANRPMAAVTRVLRWRTTVAFAIAAVATVTLLRLIGCSSSSSYYSAASKVAEGAPGLTGGAGGNGAPLPSGPFDEVWVLVRDGASKPAVAPTSDDTPGTGSLVGLTTTADGAESRLPMPLEHTDVNGAISGPVTSVTVRQRFQNPYDGKIEAVYVFPLPSDAAVSDFVMTVGERRIRGIIRERQEAEQAYAAARQQGYVAALLTEERPNVFTQKVANIEPGKTIDVEIVYYGTVGYDDGWHEWVFPMVVGPRFNPPGFTKGIGAVASANTATSAQPTNVHYLAPNERSGHEIDLRVTIDAGTTVHDVVSTSHRIDVTRPDSSHAEVRLASSDRVPNRDFVLRWKVAGEAPVTALASSRDADGGHFVLAIYPPANVDAGAPTPLELVFVVDRSGSMNGVPINQAKSAVRTALGMLRPDDTFQLIEFSNDASSLGSAPLAVNEQNLIEARRWLDNLGSGGGTMMTTGIKRALDFAHDPERLRYVVFLTDGYIGNESEIFGDVHRRLGASRVFSFGVGSSVNRHLLEGMARMGNGAMAVLLDRDDASATMRAFMERVRRPIMHDLRIDWQGVAVTEVFPARLSDLHAGRPVFVVGRTSTTGARPIAIEGRVGTQPVRVAETLSFSSVPTNPGLAKVWAKSQITELSWAAVGAGSPEGAGAISNEILAIALRNGILSPYTAFIAVDSSRATEGSGGTTVNQAVSVPQGVRYETTVSER